MGKIKEKIKEKYNSAKETLAIIKEETLKYLGEHPEVVIPIITSGIGVFVGLSTLAKSNEKDMIGACQVEDDITGLNFLTEHPMTNAEIIELGDRMMDGQSKGQALNEMGLLRDERTRK